MRDGENRVLRALQDMGWAAALLYWVSRLLSRASAGRLRLYVYHLVAQPITGLRTLPSRRGRAIEVREIGLDEALRLPVARPPAVLKARFRQGARCLLAMSEGRFIGFLWFLVGPYEEDEVRCRFVPSPAGVVSWDFDVFVEPPARLGFAFARLWDEANQVLFSLGVRWSLSRISAFNASSLASHRRLGLLRVASAVFLCAGPVQLMCATVSPYVHLGLRGNSRPLLEVRAVKA